MDYHHGTEGVSSNVQNKRKKEMHTLKIQSGLTTRIIYKPFETKIGAFNIYAKQTRRNVIDPVDY